MSRSSYIATRRAGTRAFSLMEVILVIALTAIVAALVLPTLARTREYARGLDPLADLRSHAQVHEMYASDFQSTFLYYMDPAARYTTLHHPDVGDRDMVYFSAKNLWHWPMLDSYYAGGSGPSFLSAAAGAHASTHPAFTDYFYPAAFLARPEFWIAETRIGPAQWKPTRQSDVLFPSRKGVLYSKPTMFPPLEQFDGPAHAVRIAFIDGSARPIPFRRLTAPYPSGEGDWWGSWLHFGVPVEHTIEGVRGFDIAP